MFNYSVTLAIILWRTIFGALTGHNIKKDILKNLSGTIIYSSTNASNYPLLDMNTLQKYTEEFESIGFQQVIDYSIQKKDENFFPGYARFFIHQGHQCIAEINQLFLNDLEATPMRCVIISYLEQETTFVSTDRKPDGGLYLVRLPKRLIVYSPNTSPDEIFLAHLEKRNKLIEALNLTVIQNITFEIYQQKENRSMLLRKNIIERKSTVRILFEFYYYDQFLQYEWWGDYKNIFQQKGY